MYAPNNDNPTFFQDFLDEIDKIQNGNIILTGDFNLVLDVTKDRAGTSDYNHPKSLEVLNNFIERFEMCDIWRLQNPEETKYTCHKKNSKFFSCVDFFLVSNTLTQLVNSCSIRASFNSDHSIVVLQCDFENEKRGRGFWKFNNTLLDDPKHNELVIQAFHTAMHNNQNKNAAMQWEMAKMHMAQASSSYSKEKALNRNKRLKDLQFKIEWLTFQLEIDPGGNQLKIEQDLQEYKDEMNNILQVKFKGSLFRSKCQFYAEGERSSKYYFNLEKSRYNKKVVKQLFTPEKQLKKGVQDILDIQANFFQKLYSKDATVSFNLQNISEKTIPLDQK